MRRPQGRSCRCHGSMPRPRSQWTLGSSRRGARVWRNPRRSRPWQAACRAHVELRLLWRAQKRGCGRRSQGASRRIAGDLPPRRARLLPLGGARAGARDSRGRPDQFAQCDASCAFARCGGDLPAGAAPCDRGRCARRRPAAVPGRPSTRAPCLSRPEHAPRHRTRTHPCRTGLPLLVRDAQRPTSPHCSRNYKSPSLVALTSPRRQPCAGRSPRTRHH
mmetsp:Transcript_8770/g.25507  ORF Transcript_8770/g.25507 Transcript_8770/m.25507 type:complete len:219 (+) Transcript_8770:204-860(+)